MHTSEVHKQILNITQIQQIHIPECSELLTVQLQDDRPCVWYKCDPSKRMKSEIIYMCGTGRVMHEDATNYLGTVQMNCLVWHFFYADD